MGETNTPIRFSKHFISSVVLPSIVFLALIAFAFYKMSNNINDARIIAQDPVKISAEINRSSSSDGDGNTYHTVSYHFYDENHKPYRKILSDRGTSNMSEYGDITDVYYYRQDPTKNLPGLLYLNTEAIIKRMYFYGPILIILTPTVFLILHNINYRKKLRRYKKYGTIEA